MTCRKRLFLMIAKVDWYIYPKNKEENKVTVIFLLQWKIIFALCKRENIIINGEFQTIIIESTLKPIQLDRTKYNFTSLSWGCGWGLRVRVKRSPSPSPSHRHTVTPSPSPFTQKVDQTRPMMDQYRAHRVLSQSNVGLTGASSWANRDRFFFSFNVFLQYLGLFSRKGGSFRKSE